MNNTRKEKISAFLDDSIHHDELMSFSLSGEDEDASIAQRYLMVGEALRGELDGSAFVDVSGAVRDALANENIADEMPASGNNANPAQIESTAKSGLFDLSSWWRPLAGMTVAASVAVVMVVTLSSQQGGAGLSLPVGSSPVAKNSVVPVTQPVNQAVAVNTPSSAPSDADSEMSPYINQHLEYATQDPLQGRLPYVRAVSYESGPSY